MIKRLLLDRILGVKSYPMWRENRTIEVATCTYEGELARVFATDPGLLPSFDLMLLGIGEDGHVASLFQDGLSSIPENSLAACLKVPKMDSPRITLTFDVLNRAQKLVFIIKGKKKEKVIRAIEEGRGANYPVSRIDFVGTQSEWNINQKCD